MASFHLDDGTLTVSLAGESVTLLPKEYALFAYLLNHPDRTLSREQLLDAVWPSEHPTDRTIDDHIYRLRKRLRHWSHSMMIETVRGQGYRLRLNTEPSFYGLAQHDQEFVEGFRKLIGKYHLYGMGSAMLTIAAHQDVLGIKMDRFYEVYVRFVSGKFHWIVDNQSLSFWEEKLPYLLILYSYVQSDHEKTLYYYQRALQSGKLSAGWQHDLKTELVSLYLFLGRLEQAKQGIEALKKQLATTDEDICHYLFVLANELKYGLITNNQSLLDKAQQQVDERLARVPYLREQGTHAVLKGMILLQRGARAAAVSHIDEGLNTLRFSRFAPHLIQSVRSLLFFLEQYHHDPPLLSAYTALWNELKVTYRFFDLEQKIRRELHAYL
ncbi:winged helix-turn-helix domain-containing protein [Brevibacillus humidisoli]|uniref:winged helix-turn-helix domain-containing protein n=1 Tax=Brevibacillus humidisoli TaxID=2895522 RepID=UPI001E52BD26|nr:winged helix-turn-helix domain-containing protein [Brevibacillus humidisoli]UFJ41218.1 winged helix-turn-helix domain-containing protein [Brevibacillus humidisoli]